MADSRNQLKKHCRMGRMNNIEAAMVEKICDLQTIVNEYEHLVSDLLVMIMTGNVEMNCILWDIPEDKDAELLLDKVREMVEARNLQKSKK